MTHTHTHMWASSAVLSSVLACQSLSSMPSTRLCSESLISTPHTHTHKHHQSSQLMLYWWSTADFLVYWCTGEMYMSVWFSIRAKAQWTCKSTDVCEPVLPPRQRGWAGPSSTSMYVSRPFLHVNVGEPALHQHRCMWAGPSSTSTWVSQPFINVDVCQSINQSQND